MGGENAKEATFTYRHPCLTFIPQLIKKISYLAEMHDEFSGGDGSQ